MYTMFEDTSVYIATVCFYYFQIMGINYSQQDVVFCVSLVIVMVFIVTMVTILSIVASRWRNVRDSETDGLTENVEIATDVSVWSVHGTYRTLLDQ